MAPPRSTPTARASDAGARRPGILHLHLDLHLRSEGPIIRSATRGNALCRRLADELGDGHGAVAANVDCRMPPEHPTPLPLSTPTPP